MDIDLSNRRILVVEDEYFVAEEIAGALRACHAEVLGPVPTLADAHAVVRQTRPDCAIVDLNLRGEMVFDFVDALAAATVPFVFATGYEAPMVPARFAAAPKLDKPLNLERLLEAVAGACGAAS